MRMIFRAQVKVGMEQQAIELIQHRSPQLNKMIKEQKIMTISVFRFEQALFLYCESEQDIEPYDLLDDLNDFLEKCPGLEQKRYWIPMMDIFHYNEPQNIEHWRRKRKPEKSIGRILKLKPEKISSYIYHHYQYQEEKPGDGDKYGIIGIHENLLFFYTEHPTYQEEPLHKGELDTLNTPANWCEVMEEHFLSWEGMQESEKYWRYTDLIIYM